ncbi:MAG: GIY-YIG nuclease family protein [Solirubrobacteraceae bacterium]
MFALLYLAIAPRDAVSKALLRSRLCRQHIGGNLASSTFRFGLGALLWESEGWTPRCSPSGRYRLERIANAALSKWQREHLRLAWFVVPEPWRYEDKVIQAMAPPINRDHNPATLFYKRTDDAREPRSRAQGLGLSEVGPRDERPRARNPTRSNPTARPAKPASG